MEKIKFNKQTPDAAPQEDPKNYVTQTSRHPSGHLVTGEEKPTPDDNAASQGEKENVTK